MHDDTFSGPNSRDRRGYRSSDAVHLASRVTWRASVKQVLEALGKQKRQRRRIKAARFERHHARQSGNLEMSPRKIVARILHARKLAGRLQNPVELAGQIDTVDRFATAGLD